MQPRPERGQRHGGQFNALLIQAQQGQQLAAQRLEPPPLVHDGRGGLALLVGVGLHGVEHVRIADDAGHRGFQLMGERADEVLPPLDVGLEVGDLFLHSIGHFVKAAAQRLDLIAGVQVGAAGVVPGCDLRPGVGQDGQRAGQAAGQQRRDGGRRGQHGGLQQQKAHQGGVSVPVKAGQVVGCDEPQPALQVAGVDGVNGIFGPDGHGGGVAKGEALQPFQRGADEGVAPPERRGDILCRHAGRERGIPGGYAAALQVEDLGLQQRTRLGVGGGVGGGHAAALHGKIAVQQHAPAHTERRGQDEDQQAEQFLEVSHERAPLVGAGCWLPGDGV